MHIIQWKLKFYALRTRKCILCAFHYFLFLRGATVFLPKTLYRDTKRCHISNSMNVIVMVSLPHKSKNGIEFHFIRHNRLEMNGCRSWQSCLFTELRSASTNPKATGSRKYFRLRLVLESAFLSNLNGFVSDISTKNVNFRLLKLEAFKKGVRN